MSAPRTYPVSLFSYWKTRSYEVAVNPDPPKPEEAKPFHVVIREESWIPVSILVFARDAVHARSRVRTALITCHDKQYRPERDEYGTSKRHLELAQKFLDALNGKSATMYVEVRPLDVRLICAEVIWASNGGLL